MDLFSDSDSEASSSGSHSPARLDIVESRSNDGDREKGFRINEEFARRFQHNKERTELHRLQEKYGDGAQQDTSSSDEDTEDEDGEQMTADVDAAILSTLAKIRRKDESIYQAGKRVFDEERKSASQSKLLPRRLKRPDSGKKVTLGEYQRARIQELLSTSDDPAKALAEATMIERRSDAARFADDEVAVVPHSKEQDDLRKEVTSAFHSMADGGEEGDEFFTKKEGGIENFDGPEDDPDSYRRYLVDVLGGKEDEIREVIRTQAEEAAAGDALPTANASKKAANMHPEANEKEDEDFLVNYVLNRGWIDNPNAAPKVSSNGRNRPDGGDEADDDAGSDDSFDSRAEAFEAAYNFRFQEMEDSDLNPQIQSYARYIEDSVRRKENKRKLEREERARRKQQEKEAKRRELDRLRDLKRKSIVERLKTLKEATGSTAVSFDKLNLDAEFDPDEHDRLMAEAFDEDYYEDGEDDAKPTWDDDVDITEILQEQEELEARDKPKPSKKAKDKKGKERAATLATDDGQQIAMDADFDGADDDQRDGTGKKLSKADKKKLKKREKAKARKAQESGEADDRLAIDADEMDAELQEPLAVEDVQGMSREERKKKMEEMMDQYYGLEYEDMIGDQPTRFKYTEVSKSDFGLSPVEMLLADDAELNKIVGLKRLQPYTPGNKRKAPSDLKMRLKEFRRDFYKGDRKAMAEAYGQGDGSFGEKPKQKKPGKRERERKKAAANAAAGGGSAPEEEDDDGQVAIGDGAAGKDQAGKKHAHQDEGEAERPKKKEKKEKRSKDKGDVNVVT